MPSGTQSRRLFFLRARELVHKMDRFRHKSREFAERLIACEARAEMPETAVPAFSACAHLRPHMTVLMGHAGFAALVGRALSLASEEVGWLASVRVLADGTLEFSAAQAVSLKPEELAEGGGALMIQLLGLLAEFIGEELTARLVEQTWPELSVPYTGNGVEHENGE